MAAPTEFPGFGLPVNAMPEVDDRFPVLIGDDDDDWKAVTLTVRELCMLRFIEEITNKPEWWVKAHNEEISNKWKKEAVEMDWTAYHESGEFTEEMAELCIKELRVKAEIYEKTGLIPVIDYSACAIKSDKLIPDELKEALKAAVAPFENVPPNRLDWHPGSDGKVLDLVHPSLWPLLYGRSRILKDKRITVDNCLEHCGMGDTIPVPDVNDIEIHKASWTTVLDVQCLSNKFQWLPCDVDLTGETPKIESYINNVHPVKHAALYPVIEQFIAKSLPAWDIVYRWPNDFQVQRVTAEQVGKECAIEEVCSGGDFWGCRPTNRPVNEDEDPRQDDEEEEDWYEDSERKRLDEEWFNAHHTFMTPDHKTETEDLIKLKAEDVKTSGFFNGASRVQVIVKLANIHLTPEKPDYKGGSWHIEGQLNEHICSTALYYYDCDNITDCHLDFRTPGNQEELTENLNYEQDDHASIRHTFAIKGDETLQDIGSVLTRADRMLFFPNVYQHHVSPFQLADKTRPGHRKILALFLVDPAIPIISTANVPPQQRHWWSENAIPQDRLGKLPPEVTDMVVKNMGFPISEVEAKSLREELMAERTVMTENVGEKLMNVEWSFCEH